jgi:cytochrome c
MRWARWAIALLALGAAAGGGAAWGSGDPAAGEDLYLDRCVFCHVPEGGGQGPSLTGVYGRKAASAPGFAYSAALRASGLTWTAPELDRFLANPAAAVPGTAMPISVPDARQRADIIAYLAAHAGR